MIEQIKEKTIEINQNGHGIIRLYSLFQTLDQDLQKDYSIKLLHLIKQYYKEIEELKELVSDYKKEEMKSALPVNLTIYRLEQDLKKFKSTQLV